MWQPFRDAREQFEREYFERLLTASGGNVTEAARRSGISRRHFYEKIGDLGIDPQQFGRSPSSPGESNDKNANG
jgi:DNA-binding NtrC family response regulator